MQEHPFHFREHSAPSLHVWLIAALQHARVAALHNAVVRWSTPRVAAPSSNGPPSPVAALQRSLQRGCTGDVATGFTTRLQWVYTAIAMLQSHLKMERLQCCSHLGRCNRCNGRCNSLQRVNNFQLVNTCVSNVASLQGS